MCGFVAPPSKFQDPDVDLHKKLDLRQDQQDGGGNPLEQSLNDADRDGLNDASGMPVDDQTAAEEGALDQQPQLVCSNCGEQFEAGHPISTTTIAPQDGDKGVDGPADGDVCPACGQGLLETGTEAAELGQDAEADPNAVPDEDPDPNADEEGLSTDGDGDGIPDGEDPDPDDPTDPDPDAEDGKDAEEADDDSDSDFDQEMSKNSGDNADDEDSDEDDEEPVRKPRPPFKR